MGRSGRVSGPAHRAAAGAPHASGVRRFALVQPSVAESMALASCWSKRGLKAKPTNLNDLGMTSEHHDYGLVLAGMVQACAGRGHVQRSHGQGFHHHLLHIEET